MVTPKFFFLDISIKKICYPSVNQCWGGGGEKILLNGSPKTPRGGRCLKKITNN